jgi:hypothetical protein
LEHVGVRRCKREGARGSVGRIKTRERSARILGRLDASVCCFSRSHTFVFPRTCVEPGQRAVVKVDTRVESKGRILLRGLEPSPDTSYCAKSLFARPTFRSRPASCACSDRRRGLPGTLTHRRTPPRPPRPPSSLPLPPSPSACRRRSVSRSTMGCAASSPAPVHYDRLQGCPTIHMVWRVPKEHEAGADTYWKGHEAGPDNHGIPCR